jgi:putative ABC transport system permease protein
MGSDITINGISFLVIGVFKSLANGGQQQEEERVYLPNDTLRYAFNQTGVIGSLVFTPKPGLHARVAETDVKAYLAQINKVSPDDKGVFGSCRKSTTRWAASSPASRCSAGSSPSARSSRVRSAWETSC